MEIAKEKAPQWFASKRWNRDKMYWSWSGNKVIREALEEFAYSQCMKTLGFERPLSLKRQAMPLKSRTTAPKGWGSGSE